MDLSGAEIGPKMQACSEKERNFVWAYLRTGGKSATAAARDAGYPDNGTGGINVRAHALIHRERVLAAIDEVGRQAFRALLVPAVNAMENLINNPDHPDHARTVATVLARLGLGERTTVDHNVSGEVTINHTDAALDDLRSLLRLGVARSKLEEIFGHTGLPRYERMLLEADSKRPKTIDHQPSTNVSRET